MTIDKLVNDVYCSECGGKKELVAFTVNELNKCIELLCEDCAKELKITGRFPKITKQ